MNISEPFIRRPVGTTLLAIGLFLAGAVAYFFLPVSSLPAVDLPTIRVIASRPGADPATMAASVAAPLERRLTEISGVAELTSSSSLGSSVITVQFDTNRKIENAARDVQAAINAAATDLPLDLPVLPTFRKANPAAAPILILTLTSDTIPASAIYDAADTVIAQRLSQVEGVAEVSVSGAEQPAIRVRVDPARLAAMGVGLDTVANAIVVSNAHSPVGALDGATQATTLETNDQLFTPRDYSGVIVANRNGTIVRLADVATVERGVRNTRSAGWYNHKSAVLLIVTKQADANVIATVDRVKALLPELQRWVPADIDVSVLSDRTITIRSSISELQRSLVISIGLVMIVMFVFMRRGAAMLAAGITVPLSFAGTFIAMWATGMTLDNISLMAIIVAVGFVVDDAIVVIENIYRNMEEGMPRLQAALEGAKQIGFTIVSIGLSLIAAFIPLIFMPGVAGKIFSAFSLTLVYSITASTIVSLTVTPMVCAVLLNATPSEARTRFDKIVDNALDAMIAFYARTLKVALRHSWLMLIVMVATIALTVQMFRVVPKGYLPQDDSGLLFGFTEASADVSFDAMSKLQQQATDIVLADPAVESAASFIGGGAGGGSLNQGRIFMSLKPEAVRGPVRQVMGRLRIKLSRLAGIGVFMVPSQDVRVGGRQSKSQYQFTLWSPSLTDLEEWVPKILAAVRKRSEVVDVTTDREQGGLKANVVIDRDAAARLGVGIQNIDTALNTAFGQRQSSIIYTQRNQYRVIIETALSRQRDPSDLSGLYVSSNNGAQVPLGSVARVERGTMPLVVNHQGPFPATTISFNSAPDVTLEAATQAVSEAAASIMPPDNIRMEFAGDARDYKTSSGGQGLLIVAALAAVYIILGVLYESLLHPITIISTLPSAGLGALLALYMFGSELTIIAFVGIILLIGIVKKNGIMLVDFAIAAERGRALEPAVSALEASVARFRPILMTTLAAMFGAMPLAFATGAGSELRRPLGLTIVGGLLLSQVLTLYTTPVIYMLMSRLSAWRRNRASRGNPIPAPAE